MRTFEKYYEYVKAAFTEYPNIAVIIYHQTPSTLMVRIKSNFSKGGCLEIRFDQDGIAYFGSFFVDDYMDDIDKVNTWEIRTEKEILQLLDIKIEEYKHYIENGYYFRFYNQNNELEKYWPYVYTGDINKIDYKKVYLDQLPSDRVEYNQIKSVIVTNFYGDIIVDNKILH